MINTIITGPPISGKTTIARAMVECFNKEEVAFLDGRSIIRLESFIFSSLTQKTKIVVLDDLIPSNYKVVEDIINSDAIVVNKAGKSPFKIKPNFIFIFKQSTSLFAKVPPLFINSYKPIKIVLTHEIIK